MTEYVLTGGFILVGYIAWILTSMLKEMKSGNRKGIDGKYTLELKRTRS